MTAFILAGTRSDSGKTLLTAGLLQVLAPAVAAKVGPDYIDPTFHARTCGAPCFNLDPWLMPPPLLRTLLRRAARGKRHVVIEGAMGLFDGAANGQGATASLARALNLPVVLVIDATGQAQSVAATARGFAAEASECGIALIGVVANRVAGARHRALIEGALAKRGIPLLGAVRRDDALTLPKRHLGLVPAATGGGDDDALDRVLARIGTYVAEDIDTTTLLALAAAHGGDAGGASDGGSESDGSNAGESDGSAEDAEGAGEALGDFFPAPHDDIAVARDRAFVFAYPHLLEAWRDNGARLHFFSPLADEPPPREAGFIFLPGGYPELHAAPLAAATRFREGLRRAAGEGAAIYGECGGYMALGESLVDAAGARHAMTGLLPLETSFAKPRLHLGYRTLTPHDGGSGGSGGAFAGARTWRGHEFHYTNVVREEAGADVNPLFSAHDAQGAALGQTGLQRANVCGSFAHLVAAAPA